jgi:hypothetical protein
MLEIILLVFWTKKIGAMCLQKGRKAGGYKALAVLLWFGGEIMGAIIGVASTSGGQEEPALAVYGFALVGAAVGTGITYAIVSNLSALPAATDTPGSPPPIG